LGQNPGRVAGRLADLLHHYRHLEGATNPIYYLACQPTVTSSSSAQLALTVKSLGWPAGHWEILTLQQQNAGSIWQHALERLRQLFAGGLELVLINHEPSAMDVARRQEQELSGCARVREILHSHQGLARWPIPALLNKPTRDFDRRPSRQTLVPRYPIVFCHGMLAMSMLRLSLPADLNTFSPLRDFLRQRGLRVLFPQVPPTGSVMERARILRDQIRAWTDEPVNLIAHSMGGLDARCAISRLDLGAQVKTLTTISTPNQGTYAAEWFLANFRQRIPLLRAFEFAGVNVAGFGDCVPSRCRVFNADTPDHPEVRYFSWAGEVGPERLAPTLRRPWSILTPVEGPNDGMVSVQSARWGEFLGIAHADHFAQTPDGTYLRPGEDFDCLGFYCRMVEDLARRGF
jgi:triacylglycerol lipase